MMSNIVIQYLLLRIRSVCALVQIPFNDLILILSYKEQITYILDYLGRSMMNPKYWKGGTEHLKVR